MRTAPPWTWRGALEDLAAVEVPGDRTELPGTIVVGRVAGLPLAPHTAPAAVDPAAFFAAAMAGNPTPS